MFSMKKGHRVPPILENQGIIPVMPGFDQEAFDRSVSGQAVIQNQKILQLYPDEMDPHVLAYWKQYGVRKELFDADINEGKGKYSVHSPLHIAAGRKLPLLYFSHPGFETPYQAETAGFSQLIEREQFIAVYPFNGGYSNEDVLHEFPRIMHALKEKEYPIDWTRVYAAGFSSGSDATESIATQWPELIAACAPCPGSNAFYNSLCRVSHEAYAKCDSYQVPLICVGGDMDFGDRYPFPDPECYDNFNLWMKDICKVKDWKDVSFAEGQSLITNGIGIERKIGVPFEKKWTEIHEERNWLYGQQFDSAHRPICQFVCGEGVPHVMTGCVASIVYEALKHWQRDRNTGQLFYSK